MAEIDDRSDYLKNKSCEQANRPELTTQTKED